MQTTISLAEARTYLARAERRIATAHTDEGRYNAESQLKAVRCLIAKLEAAN